MVEVLDTIEEFISKVGKHNVSIMTMDIETSGFNLWDEVLSIGVAVRVGKEFKAYVVEVGNREELTKVVKFLSKYFLIVHNSIFDITMLLYQTGVDLTKNVKDTLIIYHEVMTDRQYYNASLSLKELAYSFTDMGGYEEPLITFTEEYKKKHKIKKADFSYKDIPRDILLPYNGLDCIATFKIYEHICEEILKRDDVEVLRKNLRTLHEANSVFIKAKSVGVRVDYKTLDELYAKWEEQQKELYEEILNTEEVKEALKLLRNREVDKYIEGRKTEPTDEQLVKVFNSIDFNLNSNNHKSVLFFEVLNLKPIGKTKKGNVSVGVEFVDAYKESNAMVGLIDKYNLLEKGKSFITNYKENSSKEGRLHPEHNINGTVSRRTTTTNPNLAQTPSRGILSELKKAFLPDEGHRFISFDYQAMEIMILASLSGEKNMMKSLKEGLDLHSVTALMMFKDKMSIPEELSYIDKLKYIKANYDKTYRYYSKTLSFGLIYGMTPSGLAKQFGVKKAEAEDMVNRYFEAYPGIKNFIVDTKNLAKVNGYASNYIGYRVRLNSLIPMNDRDYTSEAEQRFCVNFAIQSFGAAILYTGLEKFKKYLSDKLRVVFTIYDAVYVSADNSLDFEYVKEKMKECFTYALPNGLELGIDVIEGNTWKEV